jgi:signal transduction histidine kinase
VLAASLTWIYLLHQKVEQRTAALDREMRQRKEAELQRAAEQERSRIARDLHDDLGASLTEISLLAEMGQSQAAPQSTKERFDEIADKSRALVNSMDVIVWAADPDDDDLESFADYVTSFARMFLESSGIACRFKVPIEFPQTRITGGVRHDLVLAIKEALNNIVRHARASEVDFGLQHDRGRLTVSICDNGCGFEAATVLRGNGLTNLEQRLTRMGGACDIESAHGGGTKVRLTLDLGLAL